MTENTDEVVNSYEISPDKQQLTHKVSCSLSGETPSRKHTQEDLLRRHYQNIQHIQGCSQASAVKQIVIPSAYSPSTVPLDQLRKISLEDLKLETHHRGSFITATTITPAYEFSETITIIQEESGNVAVLILAFHDDYRRSSRSSLPQNSTVAIKEPYVQFSEDSGYVIRVDHPSDIAVLRGDDPAVSMIMQFVAEKKEITPLEWKAAGDKAYLERKYTSAIECYTQAIDGQVKDESFLKDSLRKRAFANLTAERFENAKQDALSSCSGNPTDAKAFYTAGRAAYELRNYTESKEYFAKALELSPRDAKARKDHNRTLARIDEEELGNYDFRKMVAALSEKHVHLDHADFSKNVKVGITEHKGRGLFSTRDIEAGKIILCEKAFCLPDCYAAEDEVNDMVLYNFNNNSRTNKSAQAAVYLQLVQDLYKNQHLNSRFYDLDGGEYVRSRKEGSIVDGVPIVDAFVPFSPPFQRNLTNHRFLAEAIRLKNCFGSPRLSRHLLKRNTPLPETHLSIGIWTKAAYLNHSCLPNCTRAFIGDMMIIRALYPIPSGTELTQQYITPDASCTYRRKMFPNNWDFECSCRLCEGEKASPDVMHHKRRDLAQKIKTEVLKVPKSNKLQPAAVKQIERLTKKLEDLHEPEVYATLPRLLLVHPGICLMEAHRYAKNYVKMLKYALEVLRNFGFVDLVREEGKLVLDWETGIVNTESFNALRIAAEGFEALGDENMKVQCETAAKRIFVVLAGCDVGMEEIMRSE
ncbi:hypothetical protein G7Y89_g3632 [Cudoniella acicularis]|uniref:SET domain-containing protein n=1 Tax=Cudoniella acicularis TaxID=354080 RepID=A0A8H4RSW0_9HELO|nr:hypothetical protein G7Y89_g3632 [Cudoniella acicularis]